VSAAATREAWPAGGAAVPAARDLVRTVLRDHGLAALVDSAELIVSELVGNVVLHVGGTVEVALEVAADEVLLSVSDDSPLSPHLRVFSRTSSTGRGMRLVHSLSAEHGVRPRGHGKTIWVRLTPASSARGDDEIAEVFADVDWIAELADIDLEADLDAGPVRDRACA
jgi:anti-sigma regulatory factor (Ser/Thr protein kinase)